MTSEFRKRTVALSLPRIVWVAVLSMLAIGCGSTGPERVVVSGVVTFDGQPIENGRIRFFPKEGTDAPMSGAVIRDGRYTVDHQGGVPVGDHTVEIEGHRVDPRYAALEDEMSGETEGDLPKQQFIPEQYNKSTKLEITIAPGGNSVVKDFTLLP
jgi:hypothetical protein